MPANTAGSSGERDSSANAATAIASRARSRWRNVAKSPARGEVDEQVGVARGHRRGRRARSTPARPSWSKWLLLTASTPSNQPGWSSAWRAICADRSSRTSTGVGLPGQCDSVSTVPAVGRAVDDDVGRPVELVVRHEAQRQHVRQIVAEQALAAVTPPGRSPSRARPRPPRSGPATVGGAEHDGDQRCGRRRVADAARRVAGLRGVPGLHPGGARVAGEERLVGRRRASCRTAWPYGCRRCRGTSGPASAPGPGRPCRPRRSVRRRRRARSRSPATVSVSPSDRAAWFICSTNASSSPPTSMASAWAASPALTTSRARSSRARSYCMPGARPMFDSSLTTSSLGTVTTLSGRRPASPRRR